jgi:hypothetical protein
LLSTTQRPSYRVELFTTSSPQQSSIWDSPYGYDSDSEEDIFSSGPYRTNYQDPFADYSPSPSSSSSSITPSSPSEYYTPDVPLPPLSPTSPFIDVASDISETQTLVDEAIDEAAEEILNGLFEDFQREQLAIAQAERALRLSDIAEFDRTRSRRVLTQVDYEQRQFTIDDEDIARLRQVNIDRPETPPFPHYHLGLFNSEDKYTSEFE